ncbi:MAG TPA: hypothetical protein QGF58_03705 [Myxococcota bacterium]|nr:hypothetical protein [Myxococcota bacterium]
MKPSFFASDVAAPLAVGSAVYLLWRSSALRVFDWVRALGLGGPLGSAREAVEGLVIPEIVLYSLPDALWTYALTAFMGRLWRGRVSLGSAPWLGIGVLIGCGGEGLQAIGLLPGTFDVLDLLLCAAAGLLAFGRSLRREPPSRETQ